MIKVEITGENPLEVFAQTAVYGVKLLQIPEVAEASDLVTNMEKHWKRPSSPIREIPYRNLPPPQCRLSVTRLSRSPRIPMPIPRRRKRLRLKRCLRWKKSELQVSPPGKSTAMRK